MNQPIRRSQQSPASRSARTLSLACRVNASGLGFHSSTSSPGCRTGKREGRISALRRLYVTKLSSRLLRTKATAGQVQLLTRCLKSMDSLPKREISGMQMRFRGLQYWFKNQKCSQKMCHSTIARAARHIKSVWFKIKPSCSQHTQLHHQQRTRRTMCCRIRRLPKSS